MELAEILARIDRSGGPDACHEWRGARLPKANYPYGMVRYQGKLWRVHRLVWALANGPIPDGRLVCHTCDNPPCANVTHLFLGDHAANAADMVAKGRASAGGWSGVHWMSSATPQQLAHWRQATDRARPRGEAAPGVKLTTDQVIAIRAEPDSWGVNARLAREHGVSAQQVGRIRRREVWRGT